MLRNYLKVTFRNLRKNKSYTLINITGLALSISICLMIIIYIFDQTNVDSFHTKKDRIVRLYTTDRNSNFSGWATSPGPLKEFLTVNYPFIEKVVRFCRVGDQILNTTTPITVNGFFAETEFFSVFDFPLDQGDPISALQEPNTIVITKETADKIFAVESPIGKTIKLENLGDFIITGVLKELPHKSHLVFDFLISFSTFRTLKHMAVYQSDYFDIDSWTSFRGFYHYLLLKNVKDFQQLEGSLVQIKKSIFPPDEQNRFGFKIQPLSEINFGLNLINPMPGTKHTQDIALIPVVAIIIIFLACFNYIILSVAQSLKRIREIGLRKVLGSKRHQIIKLFLSEAFILSIISLFVACLLITVLVPLFNSIDVVKLNGQQINLDFMQNFTVYITFILFAVVVSLLAGLYPALYFSSFLPVNALKGISAISRNDRFITRKLLMTIQFIVSIVSIILIVIIYKQHLFMIGYDKGISTDNTAFIRLRQTDQQLISNKLQRHPDISDVSFSSIIPAHRSWGSVLLKSEMQNQGKRFDCFSIDASFITNFGLTVVAGENFSHNYNNKGTIILNEKAVTYLGFGSNHEVLGKFVEMLDIFNEQEKLTVQIIGVLKDFNYKTLYEPIGPLVLQNDPQSYHYAIIHYQAGNRENIKSIAEEMAKEVIALQPLEIQFYGDLAEAENSFLKGFIMIAVWCCGFIILIALMGLLGLVSYTSEMRVKEISIRKILGASMLQLSYLLGKEYMFIIFFAALIAVPIAWYSSNVILQAFAFRTSVSFWVFPAVIVVVSILALTTISSQTIKTAITNPADTLREE